MQSAGAEVGSGSVQSPWPRREFSGQASYRLSTGDIGEAYVVADTHGYALIELSINGQTVIESSVTLRDGEEPQPVAWLTDNADYPLALLIELAGHAAVGDLAVGMVPQEFKCSRWGRKVMKAAKYAVYGTATAITAACCTAATAGCLVCAFAAGSGAGAAGDAFDGYCE